jgi:hypothetical protein
MAKNQTLDALNTELDDLTVRKRLEMTREDYNKLLDIKNRLRALAGEGVLDDEEQDYCGYLVQCAYRNLNKMEEHYENNGNKW